MLFPLPSYLKKSQLPEPLFSVDYSISLTSMDALEQLHHGHWFSATYFWSEKLEVTRFQPHHHHHHHQQQQQQQPTTTTTTTTTTITTTTSPDTKVLQVSRQNVPNVAPRAHLSGRPLLDPAPEKTKPASESSLDLGSKYIKLLTYTLSTCVFICDCVVALADKNSLFHINVTPKIMGVLLLFDKSDRSPLWLLCFTRAFSPNYKCLSNSCE